MPKPSLLLPVYSRILSAKTSYGIVDSGRDYEQIEAAFTKGVFTPTIREQLAQLLDEFSSPLTIRSSSVLEDNLRYSFAGKYLTIFVTNNGTREERLAELEQAVKLVFASISLMPWYHINMVLDK